MGLRIWMIQSHSRPHSFRAAQPGLLPLLGRTRGNSRQPPTPWVIDDSQDARRGPHVNYVPCLCSFVGALFCIRYIIPVTFAFRILNASAWLLLPRPRYHRIAGHGGIFEFVKPPNIWQYLKIQQDCQQRGKIRIIEDTKYVTMLDNTTRLQATGKNWSCWSHPIFSIFEGTTRLPATGENLCYWSHQKGNVWKYHQIAGHGPNIFHYLKTQTRFPATETFKSLKPPNMWQCLKILEDCRPRDKI